MIAGRRRVIIPQWRKRTMIPKELVDRINALARKSREEGLTESEKGRAAGAARGISDRDKGQSAGRRRSYGR